MDDVLSFLESSVEQQDEDIIASKTCYNEHKDKIFGIIYSFKPFLTKNKERLYLRVAMLHLEKEGLIYNYPNLKNTEVPVYLITYSGLILVRNGGYCKKVVLDRLKEFLQRLAWVFAIIGLLLNAYICRDKLTSFCTSTPQEEQVKEVQQEKTKVVQE
ncbi:hypothetical protein P3875_06790 [Myroides sp. JBRI-B21084]|uniref:hypothetical protein n=1 Tax=Myroides sp. JBRI-B21084 TaxID=3119977 RepID=UPI0026E2BBDA|nr:hypothetical protein [Paenimyroides cloacae]WKW45493.1 hypothetical protein P3875_06790 [Paenimyroides cloacae]